MRQYIFTYLIILTICHASQGFWPFSHKKKPSAPREEKRLSPVIFVPGDGGSQLYAKLNKSSSPIWCANKSDWFNIWLNLELIVIPAVYCWVENVKLYYDAITRTTHNTPGVETRIQGWGDPAVVEWIDPTHNKAGAYFKDIGNMLVDMGYERRKNLHGAPYDFRKAPNELKQYFIDLKELVEDSYEANYQTRVTFISHSMGSPMTLVFLQQQSVEWKEKYVERLISLAGAWAGSVKALKVFAMGDDLDSFFLSGKILKAEQITHPSSAWLLPSPLFWKTSETLVETPTRIYTMSQMQEYFKNIGYPTAWEMRKDTLHYTLNFSPPGVDLHCLYGDGLDTVERLRYKKDDLSDDTPKLIMGIGDGTVNRRSLQACHQWNGYQSSNISTLALAGVDHMGILANKDVLDYMKNVMKL